MHLLLVRHGQAVDEVPDLGDAGRWLTGHGRTLTRRVAAWLAQHAARTPVEIWSSPLVRAVQTAEIVAQAARIEDRVLITSALTPSADPDKLHAALLRFAADGPLALVGHEPSLSLLAVSLLGMVDWPGIRKSGVVGLRWSGQGKAELTFLLKPKKMKILRSVDDKPA